MSRHLPYCLAVLAGACALAAPLPAAAEPAPAVLIVEHAGLAVATPCAIGLYLHGNLAARLYQGQTVAFNLPPGPLWLRLQVVAEGACRPGIEPLERQHLELQAGQVRRYRIALGERGFQLLPAP